MALTEYTTEGIPALPETASEMGEGLNQNQGFNGPVRPAPDGGIPSRAPNGIPMFVNKARRQADGAFRLVEFVNIKTPGDNKNMPCRKVTDALRQKYKPWYDAWRAGLENTPSGTPIEAWPVMDSGTAQAAKAINIFTVEQLAETADASLHRLPMGRTLKNRAIEWLKIKDDADAIDALARQKEALTDGMKMVEDQNMELTKKLEGSNSVIEQMAARLEALEKAQADKPVIIDNPIKPVKKEA